MKKTKICGICEEEFEVVYPNHKYCSPECVKKSEGIKSKKWRDNNPEKVKETNNAYYYKDPVKCKEIRNNWIIRNKEKFSKANARYYQKNREIILIRASDRKKIVKVICEVCGSKERLEIHHFSYKPSIYLHICAYPHIILKDQR